MPQPPPLFSIIIPTFNRGHLILKTLHSALNQTEKNYEIIVVDNCSTDNTKSVLAPFAEKGEIIFIQHEQNYERAQSRNTGMLNAKGEYVTFLDSDDLMYPNCLENATQFILQNKESLIFHNLYELIDEKGNSIYNYSFPKLTNQLSAIANGNFLSNIGVFIHRSVYTNPKFHFDTDPRLIGFEDWEIWFRILAAHKLSRINVVASGVVQHPERAVNNFSISDILSQLKYFITKIKDDQQLSFIYGKYIRRIEASSYIYGATTANRFRNYKESLNCLYKAFLADKTILAKKRFIRSLQIALFRLKL